MVDDGFWNPVLLLGFINFVRRGGKWVKWVTRINPNPTRFNHGFGFPDPWSTRIWYGPSLGHFSRLGQILSPLNQYNVHTGHLFNSIFNLNSSNCWHYVSNWSHSMFTMVNVVVPNWLGIVFHLCKFHECKIQICLCMGHLFALICICNDSRVMVTHHYICLFSFMHGCMNELWKWCINQAILVQNFSTRLGVKHFHFSSQAPKIRLDPNPIPMVWESGPIKFFLQIVYVAPNSKWIEVCGEVMNDDQ